MLIRYETSLLTVVCLLLSFYGLQLRALEFLQLKECSKRLMGVLGINRRRNKELFCATPMPIKAICSFRLQIGSFVSLLSVSAFSCFF